MLRITKQLLLAACVFSCANITYANPMEGFDTSKALNVRVSEQEFKDEMVLVRQVDGKTVCRVVSVQRENTDPAESHGTHNLKVYGCDTYEQGTAKEK